MAAKNQNQSPQRPADLKLHRGHINAVSSEWAWCYDPEDEAERYDPEDEAERMTAILGTGHTTLTLPDVLVYTIAESDASTTLVDVF